MKKLLRSITPVVIATAGLSAQAAGDPALAARYTDCAAIYSVMSMMLEQTAAVPPVTQAQQADTARQYKAQGQLFMTQAIEQAPQKAILQRFTDATKRNMTQVKRDGNIQGLWAASAPCRAAEPVSPTDTKTQPQTK